MISGPAVETPPLRQEPGTGTAAGLVQWLLEDGRDFARTRDLLGALCRRIVSAGVPVSRAMLSVRMLHPQIVGTGYLWHTGMGAAEQVDRSHDLLNAREYLQSPIRMIHEGGQGMRRRLDEPGVRLDVPILEDLARQGMTGYLIRPVRFSDGSAHAISFATASPGGFTDAHVAVIEAVLPAFSTVVEVQTMRRVARTLLDTYLGHQTGERVLRGQITRGSGETIHAVVWYGDLRGFTRLSDMLPRDELIALLNDYFGRMVAAIEGTGGEVLKFIGDGLLAIFPLGDAAFRHVVCHRALDAAHEARRAMGELNAQRTARGLSAVGFGIALHVGDVMYGNIGGDDRLDFTVIGPAVNHVARIEELTKSTGCDVLISEAVAATCERPLVSLGRHRLRGVEVEQEVFALPQLEEPAGGGG